MLPGVKFGAIGSLGQTTYRTHFHSRRFQNILQILFFKTNINCIKKSLETKRTASKGE